MSHPRSARLIAVGLSLALGVTACGGSDPETSSPTAGGATNSTLAAATLNGSGATFPKAFYDAAIDGFKEVQASVTVNYGGGGSGKGRTDLQGGLVDFAGTDGLVKEADKAKFKGEFTYIPTVAAPITVSYNLSGVNDLTLDADTTAKIFQRDIKSWDDPAIKALNPTATLPSTPIIVAHRADGSGTTENFTGYLVKAAPSWKLKSGSTVEWPADTQAGNGNAGVAQIVKTQGGAVGYVDLSDANTQQLTYAKLKNKSGKAVEPTLEATTKALEGVELNPDLSYDPLDSANPDAYPIAAPTWMLAYKNQTDKAKGEALKAFLGYLVEDGQKLAEENDYAALPSSFTDKAKAAITTIVVPA
ncbi:MAG: Phosphate ABC transporter, periplasmic phosphate-binding protein PstS [uncultured Acidimicrobiales bacterium]|uniref:Phosphate-binding protein n=1 Tax=uncultured Acidimicrobiales bacterium TaxID=310071 RepID=A0A6J4HUV1_9ACTN|nr:MAG: Phosphate ABC transporter, periplasmic phosphate-binding protein PstS [uncultured Acidimicrobiales bacterium]